MGVCFGSFTKDHLEASFGTYHRTSGRKIYKVLHINSNIYKYKGDLNA